MKNKLIVLEGIDGVGKTSLAKALEKELISKKYPAIYYESLENKKAGFNQLKPFIKDNVPVDSSLLFYLASSIYKSQKIKKILKTKSVICDRYLYSTLANHKTKGADISLVHWKKLPIVWPDFLFLIIAKEKIRLARAKKRKNATLNDLIKKERNSFAYIMEKELKKFKPIIIDNSGDLPQTLGKILSHLSISPHSDI